MSFKKQCLVLLRNFFLNNFYSSTFGLIHHLKPRLFGDRKKLKIANSASVANALFNTLSGKITIGEYVIFGHNVTCIAGTHDINKFGSKRYYGVPLHGCDIVIEDGAFIASNATIIGPCKIGKNAVVCAGAVVTKDVLAMHVVGGVPAKVIRVIKS